MPGEPRSGSQAGRYDQLAETICNLRAAGLPFDPRLAGSAKSVPEPTVGDPGPWRLRARNWVANCRCLPVVELADTLRRQRCQPALLIGAGVWRRPHCLVFEENRYRTTHRVEAGRQRRHLRLQPLSTRFFRSERGCWRPTAHHRITSVVTCGRICRSSKLPTQPAGPGTGRRDRFVITWHAACVHCGHRSGRMVRCSTHHSKEVRHG